MFTERVATSRRAPAAVVLVALALVALLAWKPWAGPVPVVTPSPSIVARQTPTASLSPTATPVAPTPTVSVTPVPTPVPTPAIVGITLATVTDPLTASVGCRYVMGRDGASVLKRIKVAAPIVVVTDAAAAASVRRVAWHARLEVNGLDTLFSADWESVDESARQFALALPGDPLPFRRLTIDYNHPMGPALVVRVVVVVEWFALGDINLGSTSIVATTYAHGVYGPIRPEGCHTFSQLTPG